MDSFQDRLAYARKKKGLSQTQLADLLSVKSGKQTIYNWEKGDAEPRLSQIKQVAQILEVPLGWLVSGSETEVVVQYTVPPDKVITDASEAAELYRIKSQMLEQKLNQSNP